MKILDLSVVLVVFISLSPDAFTQTKPRINIGIDLQLGMTRDAVVAKLAANYKVEKLREEGDDWFVADKSTPEVWIGTLGFHDGKLTYASRLWTEGRESSYEFAEALRGAMTQMSDEDQHSCRFDTPTTRSPAAEINYVRFYCGPKRIQIMITNVLNGMGKRRSVQIEEVLSSEENR